MSPAVSCVFMGKVNLLVCGLSGVVIGVQFEVLFMGCGVVVAVHGWFVFAFAMFCVRGVARPLLLSPCNTSTSMPTSVSMVPSIWTTSSISMSFALPVLTSTLMFTSYTPSKKSTSMQVILYRMLHQMESSSSPCTAAAAQQTHTPAQRLAYAAACYPPLPPPCAC